MHMIMEWQITLPLDVSSLDNLYRQLQDLDRIKFQGLIDANLIEHLRENWAGIIVHFFHEKRGRIDSLIDTSIFFPRNNQFSLEKDNVIFSFNSFEEYLSARSRIRNLTGERLQKAQLIQKMQEWDIIEFDYGKKVRLIEGKYTVEYSINNGIEGEPIKSATHYSHNIVIDNFIHLLEELQKHKPYPTFPYKLDFEKFHWFFSGSYIEWFLFELWKFQVYKTLDGRFILSESKDLRLNIENWDVIGWNGKYFDNVDELLNSEIFKKFLEWQ